MVTLECDHCTMVTHHAMKTSYSKVSEVSDCKRFSSDRITIRSASRHVIHVNWNDTHHRSMITDRIYVSFFCFDLIPTGVHGRTTGIRIYGRRIYADKNVEYECATAS